jgi:hypothetical protein
MIEDHATISIWCDSTIERCRTRADFQALTRFDAVNMARKAGWYIMGKGFCLCPVHDNQRTLEVARLGPEVRDV